MQKVVSFILGIFRYHKLKILLCLVSMVAFLVLLFPYDDLSDLLTTQIAINTQGQVYVEFDKLGLGFFPTPNLNMEKVRVETAMFPSIKTDTLKLAPSISSLLSFKKGFNASAEGFMGGDAYVSFHEGEKTQEDVRKQIIYSELEKIDLGELKKAMDLPVQLKGLANLEASATIDPNFSEQPEAELTLTGKDVQMPTSTVPTPFGPMSLPGLKWSAVNLKGRLKGSKFVIDEGHLGQASDLFNGQVKGQMDVRIVRRGNQMMTDLGAYDLRVELNVNRAIEKDLSLFLGLLDNYKSPSAEGNKYLFRANGSRFGMTPNFTRLSSFN